MEPKTKKILITTGIVGVLSLIAYKLIASKGATPTTTLLKPTTTTDTTTDTNVDVAPPIEDMPVSPSETTNQTVATGYTSAELADLLQDDFNGNGTNWSAGEHGGIVGVLLSLDSDEDFDNLNAAYGVRSIKAGFLTGLIVKPFVGNLNSAFNRELSKSEIAAANEILRAKGITRRITMAGDLSTEENG